MLVTTTVDKKTIRQLACRFFFKSEVMYKRSYDNVLLKCVGKHEADKIMLEVQKEQVAGKDTSDGLLLVY